jgi:hypothetical protein
MADPASLTVYRPSAVPVKIYQSLNVSVGKTMAAAQSRNATQSLFHPRARDCHANDMYRCDQDVSS